MCVRRTSITYVRIALRAMLVGMGVLLPPPPYELKVGLQAYFERIGDSTRPSYGWAVLSVRTALRAVLIWA